MGLITPTTTCCLQHNSLELSLQLLLTMFWVNTANHHQEFGRYLELYSWPMQPYKNVHVYVIDLHSGLWTNLYSENGVVLLYIHSPRIFQRVCTSQMVAKNLSVFSWRSQLNTRDACNGSCWQWGCRPMCFKGLVAVNSEGVPQRHSIISIYIQYRYHG